MKFFILLLAALIVSGSSKANAFEAEDCNEVIGGSLRFSHFLSELTQFGIELKIPDPVFPKERILSNNLLVRPNEKISVTAREFSSYIKRLELPVRIFLPVEGQEKKILDVGAGYSNFVDVINETFHAKAVGVDAIYGQPEVRKLAEKKDIFLRTRLPMDARKLDFPDQSFDLIVSNTMLNWFFFGSGKPSKERIDDGFRILDELFRVLKTGGEIRVTHVPNPNGMKRATDFNSYYQAKMDEFLGRHKHEIGIRYPSDEGYGYLTLLSKY